MATSKPGSGRTKLPKDKKLQQVSVYVLPKHVNKVKSLCTAIAARYRN